MELTCPTNVARPTDGQPAPLSVNSRNTSRASRFGAKTRIEMMTGKNARTCAVTKTPSAYGRCLAPKMLKHAIPRTDAKIRSVACQLVAVYVLLLMTIKPWMIRPTSQQSRATILCHEMTEKQPKDGSMSLVPVNDRYTYQRES